ncbi:MAG: ATP-binding protein [Deltaproteobacteria bacterium]|jgi:DNA replication protein DnaC|nr:ATP-binding protein [Deltaproteobacteria bacterium]
MEQVIEIKEILNNLKISRKEDFSEVNAEKLKRFKSGLEKNIQTVLQRTGVPKRFLSPKNNTEKLKLGQGYFFHGPVGTGKTDLAVSFLKNIILNVEPVLEYENYKLPENMAMFISVPVMLLNIRSAFKSETTDESEVIKKYTKPEVLVMDDLGTEKVTEWVMQTLYVIINSRYEEEKQTIFTSNYCLEDIRKNLNDKIASRITAMTEIIELKGIDRRNGITVVK